MRVLIIGSTGFIGGSVQKVLAKEHDVHVANRRIHGENSHEVDLQDLNSIKTLLMDVQPEVIINCVGIIDAKDDFTLNGTFTENLLKSVVEADLQIKKIIISGSAGEYGIVDAGAIPVTEDTPLSATSDYGLSKIREEQIALMYREKYELPVVVARIFNPVGTGMKDRFLIPNLLKQIEQYKKGVVNSITLSRLDSCRDYVAVDDIAYAYNAIIKGTPHHSVYNVGSGVSTANSALLELLLTHTDLVNPKIVETSDIVEPLVAIQADISRLETDFGWHPVVSLEKTIEEIIDEQGR